MPTIRSYTSAFEVVDYTKELAVVPNKWTLLNEVGLFQPEYLSTHTVTFEQQDHALALIGDQVRGSKPQANQDELRKIFSYPIPHFPLSDAVLPQDVQGKRAYGSTSAAETTDAVLARKIERMQNNFDVLKEVARWKTLANGSIYAPNGTVAGNFYTDFGISQTSVDFALNNSGTDVVAKVEAVIADMQDKATSGDIITGIIGYASPEFFAALIAHANVKDAYRYYSATEGQQILRNRAGQGSAGQAGGLYREFMYAGIRFIEVRTVLVGQRLVAVKECLFVPVGTQDVFVTYFGPANKFDFVNTIAEPGYMWTYRDPKGERIDIDAETNFVNVVRRPQLVIKGTTP